MNINTDLETISDLVDVVNWVGLRKQKKLRALGKIIDRALAIIHTAKLERQMIALNREEYND
jgi:hypothetical protein